MASIAGDRKHELRRTALERRESLCRSRTGPWGERIQQRTLAHRAYRFSRAVALYSPVGNEVPTHRIRDHALAAGRNVFYPKVGADGGSLVKIEAVGDLVPGRHGILEPEGSWFLADEDLDGLVVFVPAVLLDERGRRLGRGAGWYDRTLAELGEAVIRIALAYEFQLIEEVPTEEWDCPVDWIVTEKRVVRCGSRA